VTGAWISASRFRKIARQRQNGFVAEDYCFVAGGFDETIEVKTAEKRLIIGWIEGRHACDAGN
jgi:hypothetical protein